MDAGVQTESEVNIAAMNGNYSVFKAKKIPAWLYWVLKSKFGNLLKQVTRKKPKNGSKMTKTMQEICSQMEMDLAD